MAQSSTLPVSRLINVSVNLEPLAAQFASFSSLMVLTDNPAINITDRIMGPFTSDTAVAAVLGTTDPAYQAAVLYFSQVPTPSNLFLGRWASTPTNGMMLCGILPPADLPISVWTAVTDGGFQIPVNGAAAVNITGINLSGALNLNNVASIIDTALDTAGVPATCTWNGHQFVFGSDTTGTSSSVGFLTSPTGVGVTDLSAMMLGTAATAEEAVPGIAAETPLSAIVELDGISAWYGLMTATTAALQTSDYLAIAAYVEGNPIQPHIFGVTTQDATDVWNPSSSTDIGSQLSSAEYTHTFCIFSSFSPYAAACVFGIAFSTNWSGVNTAYTLMYKTCFGLTPERLSSTVAGVMDEKRVMYFAAYNNNTAILGFGEMSGPAYFDEIHGFDAFANTVQTNVFNVLFQSRKIPQTDPGIHQLTTACDVAGTQFVTNGLLAPGTWSTAGIGAVNQGDYLQKGFYSFAPPVATQAQADREARKSPPIYILSKAAGAVHRVNVLILVNRALAGIVTTGLALLFGSLIA